MREIVLDTETTGLDPQMGDRIVEIAAVELAHRLPTGRTWHRYLDPERDMPAEAERIHGLTADFLKGKPRFAEVAEEFLAFIADAPLVIHNAAFDLAFLNAELARIGMTPLAGDRLVDTLQIARKRFPGAPNNLDALCKRFEIDTTARDLHGALIDCALLAEAYLHLTGGRQPGLTLQQAAGRGRGMAGEAETVRRPPRPHAASPEELAAHRAFVERLRDPIWLG